MKKIIVITILLLGVTYLSICQVPDKLNYQAVVRGSTGELIVDQTVNVKVTITDNLSDDAILFSEEHTVSANGYGIVNLIIGEGNFLEGDFENIDWSAQDKYINVSIDIGNGYKDMGTTQLLSVPFAFYSNVSDSAKVAGLAYNANYLSSNGVYSTNTDTLFVVKDHNGNVVFAVFPDGAQVIVNETTKGKVGGFAVSGRSPNKAVDLDILRITPDSTRIYVNDTVSEKGKVGGFAVSGRSPNKSLSEDILYITADSTRIFVNDDPTTKGEVGGFAISGRSPSKGISSYFNVSGDNTPVIIDPSEPRVVWFPKKEAFWAGRVLIEHSDSVGLNSLAIGHEAIAKGSNSQSLGYQTRARGNFSTAIGFKTEANGVGCFAVGGEERVVDGTATGVVTKSEGTASFALGLGANASGIANTAIGLRSSATGNFASTAFGVFTKATATRATAIGYGSVATAEQSLAIGVADTAFAYNSMAMGVGSKATGIAAIALGTFVEANTTGSFVVGQLNDPFGTSDTWNTADPLFVVGNGIFGIPGVLSTAVRSNAFTILKNGNMGVGVDSPQRAVHIKDVMRLEPRVTAPLNPSEGDIYYDAVTHKLMVYDGTIWQACF